VDEKSDRAGRACRRAIPGAAASGRNPLRSRFVRVRFAPPFGPDRPARTAAQEPHKSFVSTTAILASLERRISKLLRSSRAQEARQFAAGTGCAFGEPRRPLAHPEHRDVLRTGSRCGLLFGDFLLARQEKVTRARGTRAEQDKDVEAFGCGRTLRKAVAR
jgi:hypothetical protein